MPTRLFAVGAPMALLIIIAAAMGNYKYAPPITLNEVRPHPDRGPCTNCHEVLPMVPSAASPPPAPSNIIVPRELRANTASIQKMQPAHIQNPQPQIFVQPTAQQQQQRCAIEQRSEAVGMKVCEVLGGVMITDVDGRAQRAGLQRGDIVRAIDGQPTASLQSFHRAAQATDRRRGVVVDATRQHQVGTFLLR